MHIFLSYSRQDSITARQLQEVLTGVGIRTWIDTDDLAPGTAQWDNRIRSALEEAEAVIALCSTSARSSPYVSIELEIARGNDKPILPVWIEGEIWPNCAPLSLVLSQHIDLRAQFARTGFPQLLETLAKKIAQAEFSQSLKTAHWPWKLVEWDNRYATINAFKYNNWGELLAEIYIELLSSDFEPFTYGTDWALEISRSKDPFDFYSWPVFALPSSWASQPYTAVHLLAPEWVYSIPFELRAAETRIRVFKLGEIEQKARLNFRGHLDWNNFDCRKNFLGLKTNFPIYSKFIEGKHPKMTLMDVAKCQSDRTKKAQYSVSFEKFRANIPRFELVTLYSSFFRHFHTISQDLNILDFET
jgi:TIR domain